MYETMRSWEDVATGPATTARTRLEREFDRGAVRALKDAADRDLSIGGAELAGAALAA